MNDSIRYPTLYFEISHKPEDCKSHIGYPSLNKKITYICRDCKTYKRILHTVMLHNECMKFLYRITSTRSIHHPANMKPLILPFQYVGLCTCAHYENTMACSMPWFITIYEIMRTHRKTTANLQTIRFPQTPALYPVQPGLLMHAVPL